MQFVLPWGSLFVTRVNLQVWARTDAHHVRSAVIIRKSLGHPALQFGPQRNWDRRTKITIWNCIRVMLGSDLGRDFSYPDELCGFFVLPGKAKIEPLIGHNRCLPYHVRLTPHQLSRHLMLYSVHTHREVEHITHENINAVQPTQTQLPLVSSRPSLHYSWYTCCNWFIIHSLFNLLYQGCPTGNTWAARVSPVDVAQPKSAPIHFLKYVLTLSISRPWGGGGILSKNEF